MYISHLAFGSSYLPPVAFLLVGVKLFTSCDTGDDLTLCIFLTTHVGSKRSFLDVVDAISVR